MVDRTNSSNGGSVTSGGFSKFSDLLENRLVLLVTAVILGLGSNLAIVGTDPHVRADAFTGAEGDVLKAQIVDLQKELEDIRIDSTEMRNLVIQFASSGPAEVRRMLDELDRGQHEILGEIRDLGK